MTVTLKTEGDVSIIQMDDGKVNVFSPDMIQNFNDILDQVPTDKGAMLIAGREGMFSAGFDLRSKCDAEIIPFLYKLHGIKFVNKSENEITASFERQKHKIDEIINKVKNAGMEIYDISTEEGDLEDVFIDLTKS